MAATVHRLPVPPRTVAPLPRPLDDERSMVAAALRNWMNGKPLTAREQRLVDLVVDTNWFGQLGRLVMGA